jgi:ribulose-5-phosphate 4-epimerase/fuculose-1-phosphate aldolase
MSSLEHEAARRAETTPMSEAERRVRIDLAACYRLAARYGWDDLIYTHISAAVPGADREFLVNPMGLMFEEVTASNLVKIDLDGTIIGDTPYSVNAAGFTIHGAIHEARPELKCVIHLHTTAGMAVSMLDCGLLPLSQHAMRFYNRIGYHGYQGIALDHDERVTLIEDLGPHRAMILRNHGLLTAGETVAEAFTLLYYLQKACETQLQAMAVSPNMTLPPPEVAERAACQWESDTVPTGEREWPAILRRLDREDASYRS